MLVLKLKLQRQRRVEPDGALLTEVDPREDQALLQHELAENHRAQVSKQTVIELEAMALAVVKTSHGLDPLVVMARPRTRSFFGAYRLAR